MTQDENQTAPGSDAPGSGRHPGLPPKRRAEPLWARREFVLAAVLVLLAVVVGIVRPAFLSPANLRDILLYAAIPVTAAAGMTGLIIAAQIDISIGAVMAVCAVVVALLAGRGWPIPVLLAMGMLTGTALGCVNGALTAWLGIPSIVATLATMGAIKGLLVLVTRGNSVPVPSALNDLGTAAPLGLPFPVWVAAVVCAAMGLYLSRTRGGRRLYAVGSSPRSAVLSGVPVNRVLFGSFALQGALVGVAGFLFVTQFAVVYPTPQPNWELVVIAAVVVGGTDIFGGEGGMVGTVLAQLLLSAIGIGLTFIGSVVPALRSEVQPAVQGMLILAAVLYNSLRRRRSL